VVPKFVLAGHNAQVTSLAHTLYDWSDAIVSGTRVSTSGSRIGVRH